MKMYKGFDKDMKCRGFQYEIGKTYETDKAELCKSGFHACEAPLDVFNYYPPATSQYCEVDLDDVTAEASSSDSKRVGRKIKIGARLSIKNLIDAQVEYVSEHCTTQNKTGGYGSALTGGDGSALTGGYGSALTGGDGSALTGGDGSALTGGNRSALTGGYGSALTGGDRSKFRGGMWTVFATPHYNNENEIIGMYVAVVDGKNIKPDTWYTVEDGEWVEVIDEA